MGHLKMGSLPNFCKTFFLKIPFTTLSTEVYGAFPLVSTICAQAFEGKIRHNILGKGVLELGVVSEPLGGEVFDGDLALQCAVEVFDERLPQPYHGIYQLLWSVLGKVLKNA